MGMYINPSDGSPKELWLAIHGKRLAEPPTSMPADPDKYYVCLVKNPNFTAAGVAFDERELKLFLSPDPRPKVWYEIDKKEAKKHTTS